MPITFKEVEHVYGQNTPFAYHALRGVNLNIKDKSFTAIIGQTGSGKSTLIQHINALLLPTSGSINIDEYLITVTDKPNKLKPLRQKAGLVFQFPEYQLFEETIEKDIIFGPMNFGVNEDEAKLIACKVLKTVGLDESYLDKSPFDLSGGQKRRVAIAGVIAMKPELLILDEPTAALNDDDAEHLLDLLLELKQEGLTAIIITHKLNEVMKVADKITVLRDGSTIETIDPAKETVTPDRIVAGMVGRSLKDYYPKRTPHIGEVMFEIRDWTAYAPNVADKKIVDNVNLTVRRGEIVGIAGLMGAGRTELAMSVFGRSYGTKISGHLYKDGKELNLKTVSDAIRAGIAYVTEDRKQAGLILTDDVLHNISLASLNKISKHGVVDTNAEISAAQDYTKRMNIKVSSISQLTGKLSGGNQQKVVLSKWIMTDPDLLILDEPTRGIDVGAKYEIYCIINDLIAQGKSVLMISSEMPELLGMADRIYVMNEGRIVGQMDAAEATQNKIMNCILQAKETA